MPKLIIRNGFLTCLPVLFAVASVAGSSQTQSNDQLADLHISDRQQISKVAVEVAESLSSIVKHGDNLTELVTYFESKGFDLRSLLADPRFEIYEGIGDKFRGSAEKKSLNLDRYKQILGFEHKKTRIGEFINTHTAQLKEAEETYGIPQYVIAAILGVESDFGQNIGRHNPFNTYVSMYVVDYRASFAKAQLEELLIFIRERNLDVFELKSSYAGAMAYAQFIPYSLNKWFVGDDIYDMNNNIQSVANYLAYFKKRTGSVEKAVYRYNPSSLYTELVMELAREAERIVASGP